MNKEAFLAEYRKQLQAVYAWARDENKLDNFMLNVAWTLGGKSLWNHDGECVTAAWKAIGGKGVPTLKALRALP